MTWGPQCLGSWSWENSSILPISRAQPRLWRGSQQKRKLKSSVVLMQSFTAELQPTLLVITTIARCTTRDTTLNLSQRPHRPMMGCHRSMCWSSMSHPPPFPGASCELTSHHAAPPPAVAHPAAGGPCPPAGQFCSWLPAMQRYRLHCQGLQTAGEHPFKAACSAGAQSIDAFMPHRAAERLAWPCSCLQRHCVALQMHCRHHSKGSQALPACSKASTNITNSWLPVAQQHKMRIGRNLAMCTPHFLHPVRGESIRNS